MKCSDESASIILSALMFLIVVSVLFTGLGNVIQNETRQMQLLKDNYIAKVMIQKAYLLSKENSKISKQDSDGVNSERVITFNHGVVTMNVQSEDRVKYIAELNNNYTYEQEFHIIQAIEEVENDELELEENMIEDNEGVNEGESNQEESDIDLDIEEENNLNITNDNNQEELEVEDDNEIKEY